MKYVKIKTENGIYRMPATPIAEQRADYYAGVDDYEKGSKEWQDEVEYALSDESEILDWLLNNTNPEDWRGVMVKFEDVPEKDSIAEAWTDSENFEVVEID